MRTAERGQCLPMCPEPGDLILYTATRTALCDHLVGPSQRLFPRTARKRQLGARLGEAELPQPAVGAGCRSYSLREFVYELIDRPKFVPPGEIE